VLAERKAEHTAATCRAEALTALRLMTGALPTPQRRDVCRRAAGLDAGGVARLRSQRRPARTAPYRRALRGLGVVYLGR